MNTLIALIFAFTFSPSLSANALPEIEVRASFDSKIVPFLATAEKISFVTEDGLSLSGIHFENPAHRGTIVLVQGRSETWLKFGEVFYDLYQSGYSIYSYDHRGQGLSPHLVESNPQIGYVEDFRDYTRDLNAFVQNVVMPDHVGQDLYLLSHSMGGAVAMDYLSTFDHPFKRAIFSAPMLQLNTKTYAEPIALSIVKLQILLGKGKTYAITQHDYDLNWTFEQNTLTKSESRFWMMSEVLRRYPAVVLGGTSNNWIYQSIKATHRIRANAGSVTIPFLMLQSENDQIVKPRGQVTACKNAGSLCHLEVMRDSEHEILMERDQIRDVAFARIKEFFR